MKRFTVCIEGGGSATCVSVLKGLASQSRYDCRTVVLDSDGFVAGRYLADSFRVTPQSRDPEYVSRVLDICREERVELFLPIVDYGFTALSAAKQSFADAGVHLMIAEPGSIAICSDKYETFRFFKSIGAPTPDTYTAHDGESCPFPAVVKPRMGGRAALDVHLVLDLEQLRFTTRMSDNYIVQSLIEGQEFTADCLSSLDGAEFIDAVVRTRLEVKGGLSVKAGILDKERAARVKSHIERIATTLKLPGVYNIQGFVDRNDEISFIEINPRFAGTHALTIQAGMNSVESVLDMLHGASPSEVKGRIEIKHSLKMVRYWTELFVDGDEVRTWERFPVKPRR